MTEQAQTPEATVSDVPVGGYSAQGLADFFDDEGDEAASEAVEEQETVDEGENDAPAEAKEGADEEEGQEAEESDSETEEAEPETVSLDEVFKIDGQEVALKDLVEAYKNKPDIEAVRKDVETQVKQQYAQYETVLNNAAVTADQQIRASLQNLAAIMQLNPVGQEPDYYAYERKDEYGRTYHDTQAYNRDVYEHKKSLQAYATVLQDLQQAEAAQAEIKKKQKEVLQQKVAQDVFKLIPNLNHDMMKRMDKVAKEVFGQPEGWYNDIENAQAIHALWYATQHIESRAKDSSALEKVKKAQPKVVKTQKSVDRAPSAAPKKRDVQVVQAYKRDPSAANLAKFFETIS